jgi:hypothetical protein
MSDQAITRHQRGYIYEAFNAFHVRYYTTEIVNGESKRVQRSHRLCAKDRSTGHGTTGAKAVKKLCDDHMRDINAAVPSTNSEMLVCEFCERFANHRLVTGGRTAEGLRFEPGDGSSIGRAANRITRSFSSGADSSTAA